jgi:hypothetical protein
MNSRFRRTAVAVLAVALSLPPVAAAAPQQGRNRNETDPIVRLVRKIQRVLGISRNDDLPQPPIPVPPPPPITL